jgi:hypothetical protein
VAFIHLDGDADVLGSWRADPAGLSYEVTIPPAGMIFGNDFIVEETVTWVGRHIVTHVRKPWQARSTLSRSETRSRGVSWVLLRDR